MSHVSELMCWVQVMGQLVLGEGSPGVSMAGLTMELEGVAREYQMVIPPYFALVLRAFSVIEGIALQHNRQYAIVAACFPYLSRRLLTDSHPRMQAALKQLLCGDGKRLDVTRLRTLITAFNNFTVGPTEHHEEAGWEEERVKGASLWPSLQGEVVDSNMKDALRAIFSQKGSFMQVRISSTHSP
jgi:aarF domain-containing kinase